MRAERRFCPGPTAPSGAHRTTDPGRYEGWGVSRDRPVVAAVEERVP